MKCYKCNGTGYYDIDNECPLCDGTGEYEPFDTDVELDKLYPPEQTNEEYIRTCSTEEMAELLENVAFDWNMVDKEWIIGWLKEKHTNV